MTQKRRETNKRELLIWFLSLSICVLFFQRLLFSVSNTRLFLSASDGSLNDLRFNGGDSLVRVSCQWRTLDSNILAFGFILTRRDGSFQCHLTPHVLYVISWSSSKSSSDLSVLEPTGQMFLMCVTCIRLHTIYESWTRMWPQCFVHTVFSQGCVAFQRRRHLHYIKRDIMF